MAPGRYCCYLSLALQSGYYLNLVVEDQILTSDQSMKRKVKGMRMQFHTELVVMKSIEQRNSSVM